MRRPNKSGSVIKLSGKRRRPYAVRIYKGMEEVDGKAKLKYEYIDYFEKQKDALAFLEKYNQSPVEVVKEKENSKKHRFSEIYDMWMEELQKRPKPLSDNTYRSYTAAYKNLSDLHNMIFENIALEDLEKAAAKSSKKSLSTMANIRIVLRGMYKTALRHKFVSEDTSQLMIVSYTNEKPRPHTPFTKDEIDILWQHTDNYMVRIVLILIYTGMRVRELLTLETSNVFLEDRYLIGGMKTEAGKGRIIPISEKIVPLMNTSRDYLVTVRNKKLLYTTARLELEKCMKSLGMEHYFHDTRHTCSTLMEEAGIPLLHRKLILGHKSSDITDRYTHVSKETLIADINKI